MMQTSDDGRRLILEREGCKLAAYLDSVGVPTIGIGHTSGVSMGDTCTEEQATAWLKSDLRFAEAAVNHGVKVAIEQHQFDALVSFTFNVGQGAFTGSTLLRMLNAGDAIGAGVQFDRWHIPAEITARRNAEREQFRGARFEARVA